MRVKICMHVGGGLRLGRMGASSQSMFILGLNISSLTQPRRCSAKDADQTNIFLVMKPAVLAKFASFTHFRSTVSVEKFVALQISGIMPSDKLRNQHNECTRARGFLNSAGQTTHRDLHAGGDAYVRLVQSYKSVFALLLGRNVFMPG